MTQTPHTPHMPGAQRQPGAPAALSSDEADRRAAAAAWFEDIRTRICAAFEAIEDDLSQGPHAGLPPGRFVRTAWDRTDQVTGEPGGGGVMAVMRGRVFEKVGVNVSMVDGTFSPQFRSQIPGGDESDGRFWACGVSLVAHMRSPLVPAVHMNTRRIATSRAWFGGGADITPMFHDSADAAQDAADFHTALRSACDAHPSVADYGRFKEWCDRYFHLPHRGEPRGLGGIFYDDLLDDPAGAAFAFTRSVGLAFLEAYPAIVRRRMHLPWTADERERQLVRRGRYVEFNLLYDRGTVFGLKTGGNTEAILMSLPPEVRWP